MPAKRKDGRNQSSVTVENPITGERVKRYIYAYDGLYPQAEKHSYPCRYRNPRNLSRHLGKIKGTQTEYYLYLPKLKRQLQLPHDMRFHSFRHTHATLLAEQEISAKKIQGASRTSSAPFTMDRYVHNTDQIQDGIVEMIDVIGEKYGR